MLTRCEQRTGALVAVKSVNLSKLNKKLKENLYSEIDILKGLQHPHIVALFDCKETSAHIHLVMEYCELGDLSYFIKSKEKLAKHEAIADAMRKYPNPTNPAGGLNEVITRHFLKQLASALQFLRERNFIHRDVKPQNLLLNPSRRFLTRHPNRPLVMSVTENSEIKAAGLESLPMLKLADFGFARSLPATSLAETLCGSPLYMAPEILRYEKYDAKADLWSVGTVLYEMVTGKPPFRAGNHVELLRKIEKQADVIGFKDHDCSRGLKTLIRGLLKRNPVERMSFENFFGNDVVTESIPGLVEDDLPAPPPKANEILQRRFSTQGRRTASETESRPREEPQLSSSPREKSRQQSVGSPLATSPLSGRAHSSSNPPAPQPTIRRPIMQPGVTEPLSSAGRHNVLASAPMRRGPSQDTPSPGSSLFQGGVRKSSDHYEDKRKPKPAPMQDSLMKDDYVLVSKDAVKVNALADAMALDADQKKQTAQGSLTSPKTRDITRRATTQGLPSSTTGAVQAPSSRAFQIAQGKPRPDHQRQASYERRYGPSISPISATSALTKAISGASLRLLGFGVDKLSPQLFGGKGTSPPTFYSPFPAYQTSAGISGLIADGKTSPIIDEDMKIVLTIEECATRSDVVYGFAEVKYRQLIPVPPSADHGLGGRGADLNEVEDYELLPEATVGLSEEALVLYVKSLTLLAKAMDYASSWWARRNRGEIIGSSGSPRSSQPSVVNAGNRINNAVQWVRARFNEVLEKAEFSRAKLVEAQNQLPESHPGHPSNHISSSRFVGGSGTDGVVLSSGVTAEKLMYDRALEMSRAAAISEISNADLAGCEISYVTAIRMLEAVLEKDDNTTSTSTNADRNESVTDDMNGINLDDREAVEKGE